METTGTLHDKFLTTMHKCKELRKAVDTFSHLGESELFFDDAPYSLSLFYMCRLVDRFVDAFHSLKNVYPRFSTDTLSIDNYLPYKTAYDDFVRAADSLHNVLASIDEHAEQGSFKLMSDESFEHLEPYGLQERFGWPHSLENFFQGIENIEWMINKQAKMTSDLVGFLQRDY